MSLASVGGRGSRQDLLGKYMDSDLRVLAICNYPSDTNPSYQVFIRALLMELAALDVEITVLAVERLVNLAKKGTGFRLAPRFEMRDGLPIYRPRCLTSIPSLPLGINARGWRSKAHIGAVLRAAKGLPGPFDLCLGYFLYPHGAAAAQVAAARGIPAAVLLGESDMGRYESVRNRDEISRLLASFAGIVSNSPVITKRCIERYGLPETKIRTFPNGIDDKLFYPRDREAARQHCQLPLERPIVVFVGHLIERKGPLRVLEAVQSQPEIGVVFLGKGPQVPEGPQVLFQGEVLHDEVPIWLSAADVFVLPTMNEGCSNAILEALSCGLPVVSSDLPFNHAILDKEVAILVDPNDVAALSQAIVTLIDNPEQREAMGKAALQKAQSYLLADRAKLIVGFLRTLQNDNQDHISLASPLARTIP